MNEPRLSTGTRLASMFLDHIIMSIIAVFFFLPRMIQFFITTISYEPDLIINPRRPLLYISFLGLSLYFCKDIVNGRSLGKRILKLQVVDNSTGQVASPLQYFVRNLFCIIWPIEVLVTLNNPNRRIGDRVAGTKVIVYDPKLTPQSTFSISKAVLPLILSFAFVWIVTWSISRLQESVFQPDYTESSYNDAESTALEKALNDSLSRYLSASVKMYHRTNKPDTWFVSIVYDLKENYLQMPAELDQIKRNTLAILDSRYSEGSYTGRLRYFYRSGAGIRSVYEQIGRIPK
ncbi:MAG: RDD family protein [Ferruginibacter sp.]